MRGLLSFSVVLLILQLITPNAQLAGKEKNINLFFNNALTLFTEVVNELRTSISEIREEVQILRVNLSETKNQVDYIQVETSKSAQILQDLQANGSEANAAIGRLQANASHNVRTINELEIRASETAIQITNLTILVEMHAFRISTLQSNLTSEVIPFKSNVSDATTDDVQTSKSKDCSELQTSEGYRTSGVYEIYPNPAQINGTKVYCDLETKGGGWTVIQSRSDKGPREDFQRGWQDYENGFGSPDNEHWIGLENIATLTSPGNQELQIKLTDWKNETREANYLTFQVAGKTDNYRLNVGNYIGTTGDALQYHNGMEFSTKDRDNDKSSSSCASIYDSCWWFKDCYHSNLNGSPNKNGTGEGINWNNWNNGSYSGTIYAIRDVQMKIRTYKKSIL